MNPTDFNRLCAILERFETASPRWPAILVHLIDRCDGFFEEYTFNDIRTSDYLISKTEELLKHLPNTACDRDLTELIANEFEGFYLTVVANKELWNSLVESYIGYKKRVHRISDIAVSSEPHVPVEKSREYIFNMLGADTLPQDLYQ